MKFHCLVFRYPKGPPRDNSRDLHCDHRCPQGFSGERSCNLTCGGPQLGNQTFELQKLCERYHFMVRIGCFPLYVDLPF